MPPKKKTAQVSEQAQVAVTFEKGEVEVAQDDLTLHLSGSKMTLTKGSPFSLDFDEGSVDYIDDNLKVHAEGEGVKIHLGNQE